MNEIADDEVEVGIGIHGEPGIARKKMESAKELVDQLLASLTKDLNLQTGDEVSVLVNGMGSTSLEELYVAYREVDRWFDGKGIRIHKPFVGEYATSLEMGGFSISIMKLNETLKRYLEAPVNTPFIRQF